MKRLLLAPIFLFLLGGCGFNQENPFRRDIVVESSNRDKYIVKDSSVEIIRTFNKNDYLLLSWDYSFSQLNHNIVVRNLMISLSDSLTIDKKVVEKYYKEIDEEVNKAYKEIDIARESLDGNHAILISFPIIYRPFYETKEVHDFKAEIFKKIDILCINPKLKEETILNWTEYNYNGKFGGQTMVKRKSWNGLKNENFWLDMEILKKEICKTYAKF